LAISWTYITIFIYFGFHQSKAKQIYYFFPYFFVFNGWIERFLRKIYANTSTDSTEYFRFRGLTQRQKYVGTPTFYLLLIAMNENIEIEILIGKIVKNKFFVNNENQVFSVHSSGSLWFFYVEKNWLYQCIPEIFFRWRTLYFFKEKRRK